MSNRDPAPNDILPAAEASRGSGSVNAPHWILLAAAALIPISLVWDFSWESTIGVDLVWSPPHIATYLGVFLAGISAFALVFKSSRVDRVGGVRLGSLAAPLGAWLAGWGAFAFLWALLFDRWWQAAYGLGAGIWHPPQISKAVAFFTVLFGAWLLCLNRQNRFNRGEGAGVAFCIGGALVMALTTIVTLVSTYPNRQHAAWFFQVACGTYPVVLVALATAGRLRFPATAGAAAYMGLLCAMVWLLPLFPASPQIAPVYNRLDHLMPPPFPLLLIFPAVAVDWLFRSFTWSADGWGPWIRAALAGLGVALVIMATQWLFAEFLLTNEADNWFLAGGGRHWPFFLKLTPQARQSFWHTPEEALNWTRTLGALGLGVAAGCVGGRLGHWMRRLQR